MIDKDPSSQNTFSYSVIDEIDRICDRYELELRRKSNPQIEEYLEQVPEPVRKRLLHDLVSIDFEFRKGDHSLNFDDYLKRFPAWSEALRVLEQELNASDPDSQITPMSDMIGLKCVPGLTPPEMEHFKLLEVAGSGGFGTVWRAMDLRLQREVAVKIPRKDRTGVVDLQCLLREAQMAAKLRHPNVVTVHEVGQESGISFIVTDYISGVNLKEWRKYHTISPIEAAQLMAKLAAAVQHAHDHGVIHRDLKLANVLMDKNGEPHVADFGLAKRDATEDSLAIDGQVLGTPAYMAPEQARADHVATDRRTDVYALGVILYELLTGKPPFRGDMSQLMQQIVDNPPAAPRSIKSEIPKDLEAICLKCLAKESTRRYDQAQELADDLHLFLSGETLRGIPSAFPDRIWKWFLRNRRFVMIVSSVAVVVAIASAGLMAWRNSGILPTAPLIPVEFTTDPPGCEITAVAIDADTGEPDPTKIQNGRGKTPLKMSLAAGDYLVVAVFDAQRFHEVIRHVPEQDEPAPFGYNHQRWKKLQSGRIEIPMIVIPRPDITVGMGFIEATDHLSEPMIRESAPPRVWHIPSFFFDLREVSQTDLKKTKADGASSIREITEKDGGQVAQLSYYQWIEQIEAQGKRLPSAAELYCLSNSICSRRGNDDLPCVLVNQSLISGLRSGVWEWTTTKPGGPFSGAKIIPKTLGLEAMSRMAGSGELQAGLTPTQTGFRILQAQLPFAGVRGVRSVSPRRNPQDFVSLRSDNADR